MTETILAATGWPSNAEMIEAVAGVGFLRRDWLTADFTFGRGTFWKRWRPDRLVRNDLGKGRPDLRFDARRSPFRNHTFKVTVEDFPYKLNGKPDPDVDERYGVEAVTTRDERHALMYAGLTEAVRVTEPGGFILFKCQDQVNSGRVWWQSRMFAEHAESLGCVHRDSALMIAHRVQPEGRWVRHAACKGKGCRECETPLRVYVERCRIEGVTPVQSAKTGRVWELTEQKHFGHNYSTLLILQTPKEERPNPNRNQGVLL